MTAAQRRRIGFTLIETLVALFILSLILLLGYGFMMRQPRAIERLDASEEALRALESSLETLRSGAIGLETGMLQPVIAYPPPTRTRDLVIDLEEVEGSTDTPGLFTVTLEARFRVGRAIHTRRLQSLIWRPD